MTEEQRILWIRTTLAVRGTDPQRRSFIDGFNGYNLTPNASTQMREQHQLGRQVHTVLHGARS